MHAYFRSKTSSLIHVMSHSQLLQVNKYPKIFVLQNCMNKNLHVDLMNRKGTPNNMLL